MPVGACLGWPVDAEHHVTDATFECRHPVAVSIIEPRAGVVQSRMVGMFVPEILVPGTFIDGLPNQNVSNIFDLFKNGLSDAAIALELFSQAQSQARQQVPIPRHPLYEADPEEADPAEKPATGVWPRKYVFRRPFVHAKSFLYALDEVAKALNVLAKEPLTPPAKSVIDAQITAWNTALPHLKGVRDSSHHAEDRLRGKENTMRTCSFSRSGTRW